MQLSPVSPMPTADMPYLAGLNAEQRLAVETTQGPVLVLSGAGTGKTRVLTTRIAHILNQRLAYPGQILAVTFTNKASREMGHRIEKLLGFQPEDGVRAGAPLQWLGTFHSIGMKILRRHAEKVSLTPSFTILDADDQMRVLKEVLQQKNLDPKQHTPKLYMSVIQSFKDQGLTPAQAAQMASARANPLALPLYEAYQARLTALNAVDFGDLLLHNITIFREFPMVAEEFANKFKYILVDEYQDTNVCQYLWLRLLALGHRNICCVGDDDQSIYGWRGAEVGNILRFEVDFPDATVIRLEQNYRSTSHILSAASGLIAHNKTRLGKTLWTAEEGGDPVRLRCNHDSDEEAAFVGEEIETAQRRKVPLSQMAILVRASFQTRSFEERFLTLGLPYKVIGGLRFYERQEIRDAIAYLRVIAEPRDDLALERIINTPKRGIGKATMELMHSTARDLHVSLYQAVEHLLGTGKIKGKLGESVGGLFRQFGDWREKAKELSLNTVAALVLAESGYTAMWEAEKSADAQGRVENLRELVRAMGEFESLTSFLEHVGLVTDETSTMDSNKQVSLMTLHAAKGLEFDVVFLPGWEENLFPHQRALDESGHQGLEEERRLAYVGITRARKLLYITRAERRRFFTSGGVEWQNTLPSRFLRELPTENVEDLGGGIYGAWGQSRRAFSTGMEELFAAHAGSAAQWGAHAKEAKAMIASHRTSPLEGGRQEGGGAAGSGAHGGAHPSGGSRTLNAPGVDDRVFHLKFGYGRVLRKEGAHLEIAFEKAGVKKVISDYVEKVRG